MPETRADKNGLTWLWLAAVVLLLDQASKFAVLATLVPYQDVVALTPFFNLVHVHNPGAAFSFLADQDGWQRFFFIGLTTVVAGVILRLLFTTPGRPLFAGSLALVLGGAIGNLIDRVAYGHVIDFLDLHVGGWHWPAFNVADSAISVGVVLLILDSLRRPTPPRSA